MHFPDQRSAVHVFQRDSICLVWLCSRRARNLRILQGTKMQPSHMNPPVLTPIQKSPTHLTIFSNHLLIDTVLSLVPKFGLVYLFYDVTADLCFTSKLNTSFWFPSTSEDLHGPGRVIQTSSTEQSLGASIKARRHCETDVLVAQIAFGAVLVFWTIAQWGMGLSVRRYAVRLELQSYTAASSNQHIDEEKAFYEEDSLADEYQDAVTVVQKWTCREKDSTTFIEVAEKPS